MPSTFQWHLEALSFTYQFCYDSQRRYIVLDLYKNIYVVDTLNYLKPYGSRLGTHLAKGCQPLVYLFFSYSD